MSAPSLAASLAFKSLGNRRGTALLTLLSITISVALLIGVNQVRQEARSSFTNTLSGADLIVGARSGSINLLLYSIFRIGNPTGAVSWDSYQKISSRSDVAWTFPISLGDSHRGYRVLGTDENYFTFYRYGGGRGLELADGALFADDGDAVIGAEIAAKLGYEVGTPIVVSHGIGAGSFAEHDDNPFRVAGILERTGTPVDQTVHVTLAGIEIMHGAEVDDADHEHDDEGGEGQAEAAIEPEIITAFVVGMKSRAALFGLQRIINDYRREPLSAIIPGVALTELWGLVSTAETALLVVSGFVVVAGLLGLLTTLLTSMNERRREMAVLRSVGAGPGMIFSLLICEAAILAFLAAVAGVAIVHLGLLLSRDLVLEAFGIALTPGLPGMFDLLVVGAVTLAAMLIALVPAWRGYRNSLADGLTVRI
ncbi:MAG: FtsX-like permease family protein [Pseudomonadota bacterium]